MSIVTVANQTHTDTGRLPLLVPRQSSLGRKVDAFVQEKLILVRKRKMTDT